jgi:hypothetical protein
MVAVAGHSYRIVRIEAGHYAVFRILDDLQIGTFKTKPRLSIAPQHVEPKLLDAIARAAIHLAKTSWVGHAPPLPPERRPTPQPMKTASEPPPSGFSR